MTRALQSSRLQNPGMGPLSVMDGRTDGWTDGRKIEIFVSNIGFEIKQIKMVKTLITIELLIHCVLIKAQQKCFFFIVVVFTL